MKPTKIIEFPTADKVVITYDDGSVKSFVTEVSIPQIVVPLNTPVTIIAQ